METAQQLNPYTYKPLDRTASIRILFLEPAATFSAPLIGELLHDDREIILNDLTDTRQYETVSYAWGEPVFTHWITLDRTTRLSITENVDSILRHLRKNHRQVRLWVDAICLNQQDAQEKGVQVQLMGEIYQCAQKLHLWLGSGDDQDAAAVFQHFQHGVLAMKLARRMSLVSHVPWQSAQKLLHLPWFRRRWVIQEVELSSDITVHWMSKKIAWRVFLLGLQQLKSSEEKRLDLLSQNVLDAVCGLGGSRSTVLDLLWRHHQAECSDRRDRLFSLFTLGRDVIDGTSAQISVMPPTSPSTAPTGIDASALISYTQPWASVYVGFVKMCLKNGYSKEILLHCCAFKSLSHYDINYPSWVPDWSMSRHDGTLATANYGRREIDVPTLPTSQLLQGIVSLRCREHLIDSVLGGWSPSTGSDQILYEIRGIKSACRKLQIEPGQLYRDAVADGALRDEFDAMKKSPHFSWLKEVIVTIYDLDMQAFIYTMAIHQFYVCQDRFLGFGPSTLRRGEMIVDYQQESSALRPVLSIVGRGPSSFGGYVCRIVGFVWCCGFASDCGVWEEQDRSYTLV